MINKYNPLCNKYTKPLDFFSQVASPGEHTNTFKDREYYTNIKTVEPRQARPFGRYCFIT